LGFGIITINRKTGPVAVANKLAKKPDWTGLLSSNDQGRDRRPAEGGVHGAKSDREIGLKI
jgi:hypothetical protein